MISIIRWKITRASTAIFSNKESYIERLLPSIRMSNCSDTTTPLRITADLIPYRSDENLLNKEDHHENLSKDEGLVYILDFTRPDIIFSVSSRQEVHTHRQWAALDWQDEYVDTYMGPLCKACHLGSGYQYTQKVFMALSMQTGEDVRIHASLCRTTSSLPTPRIKTPNNYCSILQRTRINCTFHTWKGLE